LEPTPRRQFSIPWSGLGIAAGLVVFILLMSLFVAWKKTPQSHIGLSYGGGPFEGEHYQRTVNPGHNLFFNGWWDKLYLYPVTQRNYIISQSLGEGDRGVPDWIPAPSSDRIEVDFEVAVYFKLNLDKLRQFHEQIGLKYRAWTDQGWDRMLNDSFRQQIENIIQEEARGYPVSAIYADPGVLLEIQVDVERQLQNRVAEVLGDRYFCGPTYTVGGECGSISFVIKRVTLPDNVVASYQQIKVSENTIQVRQNEVAQANLQAEAIRVVNDALQDAANSEAYVLLEAIKAGSIDFWVIPQGSNLALVAPDAS
jgi:hypothetical protein